MFQFFFHFTVGNQCGRRTRDNDIITAGNEKFRPQPCNFLQAAAHFVPNNGITHFFRYGKTDAMNRQTRFPPTENEILRSNGFPFLVNSGKISSFFNSVFINQCFKPQN